MKVPNIEDSLSKRRYSMPQIVDFDAFIEDLDKEGHYVITIDIPPKELTPTQKEFNFAKVDKLAEKGWDTKPIVTSDDDYVLDGHHRWLAAVKLNKKISCRVVDMPIAELIDFLKDKPYVAKRKLEENFQIFLKNLLTS